jgi:predicted Fe-Mo cluster-binding NifX family protein
MEVQQAAATTGPRIAVASTGPTAQSQVAPSFDRASYYLIADLRSGSFEAVANPNVNDTIGVGAQSAQLVIDNGAKTIITGGLSSEAMSMLTSLNATVIAGASGTVNQAVGAYVNGQLAPISGVADGDSHSNGKAKEKEKSRESF